MGKKRASIWVIEDDVGINALLCDILSTEGYSVTGQRCLKDTDGPLPDLAIIDIMLAGCSGVEVASDLSKLTNCPLIGLSASPTMVMLAEQSGLFADVLMKPFDLGDLLATVEKSLEGSKQ